jgi:hypothetical protein
MTPVKLIDFLASPNSNNLLYNECTFDYKLCSFGRLTDNDPVILLILPLLTLLIIQ